MYIGKLSFDKNLTFTHPGTKIPFVSPAADNGVYSWGWDDLHEAEFDINTTLDVPSYVGAVSITLPEESVRAVSIISENGCIGKISAGKEEFIGSELTVSVGAYAEKITIRLSCDFRDVSFSAEDIEILGAYDDDAPLLYPTPKSAKFESDYKKIKEFTAKNADEDELFAADLAKERFEELFCEYGDTRGIKVVFEKDESYAPERYTITHTESEITVKAASRIALLYGLNTLLQCSSNDGIRLATVDDMPENRLRGFHFGLPHVDRMDFAKRLVKYVLLPMRYNVIFLEFAGGMRFDRHPEISEGWLRAAKNAKKGLQPFMPHSDKVSRWSLLEKDDVRDFVKYVKAFGFELIPEVQSLAHVQYITYAHPEIAELEEKTVEVDLRSEGDTRPDVFYAHSYCPSNEKSYEIIHDIIDEIIEVTEPREYVHMGHDEVYQIGLCKKCRNTDPAELYARHVNDMHTYLKAKGLKMMLWSDMLHPAPVTTYLTHKAIDMIPRDIVMLDFIWYFNLDRDIEDNLLSHGFKVAMGNLYSSHYPRFNSRIKKEGMVGGEVSTWLICDEEILAEHGKLWDVMYLSEMLWATDSYDGRNRRAYTKIIAENIQPKLRDDIRNIRAKSGYCVRNIDFSGKEITLPYAIKNIAPTAKLADGMMAEVDGVYDRIVFEQTCLGHAVNRTWQKHHKLGEYRITYTDGMTEICEVRYGNSVMRYDLPYAEPKPQQYYRHFGYVGTWFSDLLTEEKSENGESVTIYGYIWDNPRPTVKIEKIEYRRDESDYATLILSGIKGYNKK